MQMFVISLASGKLACTNNLLQKQEHSWEEPESQHAGDDSPIPACVHAVILTASKLTQPAL